ncbi:MAG: DUF6273 domain-containing protein [Bacilli bacterium]|jgi:hypothetical protein|nr:DUF6273 domain-containing protein [Bacilli bacterium]
MSEDLSTELMTRLEGKNIADGITKLVAVILMRGTKALRELTWGEIDNLLKLGSANEVFALHDELVVLSSPTVATFQGTLTENGTAGITGATVVSETFISKVGTKEASLKYVYDGSNWHLETIDGTVVTLSDYGLTPAGTLKSNDYILASESPAQNTYEVVNISSDGKNVTILSKDCIKEAQQFKTNPELAFANTLAIIPAGKYKITTKTAGDNDLVADGTYVFTTTVAIPLGGGFHIDVIGSYYESGAKADHVPTTVKTYAADHSTVLETLSLMAYNSSTDSAAVDMGTYTREYDSTVTYKNTYGIVNFSRCVYYGSGEYATSTIRQWNIGETAAGTWWKMKSIFDIKPSNGWTDQRTPNLKTFDSELMKYLRKHDFSYYMNDSDYNLMKALSLTKPVQFLDDPDVTVSNDTAGNLRKITVHDKVCLPSVAELGFGTDYNDYLAGNVVYQAFDGATNVDRIKYYGTTAKYQWLRSTHPWNCGRAALVTPAGALSASDAGYAYGVPLACILGE